MSENNQVADLYHTPSRFQKFKGVILNQDMPRIISGLKNWSNVNRSSLVLVLVLLLNLILVSPNLMPDFIEINPHDETKYIDSGRSLIDFQFRELAWGPLIAVLYAPLHLLFSGSPDWFLIEAWAGRLTLFLMLWLSTYYLATKFRNHMHPYVSVGVLFISVPFFAVVENQSDAVFASLSAISLAQIITFYYHRNIKDVWIGSACIGLAVLARVEGLTLVGLFVVLAFSFGIRTHSRRRILVASLLPSLSIVAGFILISRISTGSFDHSIGSIAEKAYASFEWNQSILTEGDLQEGFQDVKDQFGTRAENEGSVFRAILKNPPIFGRRLIANAKTIPDYYLSMYGKKLGPVLLLFAAWGAIALIRRAGTSLLIILLVWSLQTTVSLAFLARHLVPQISYMPIIIGSIGLTYAFNSDISIRERRGYILTFFLLALYGWIDTKYALLVSGIVMTAVLWLVYLLWPEIRASSNPILIPLLILFAGGLILRGPYSFPNYPALGTSSEEQAIHYLQKNFPAGSSLAAAVPKFSVAARMSDFPISDIPALGSSEDLYNWLQDQHIRAVYAPSAYLISNPSLKNLLEQGAGPYFNLAFTRDPGSIQIFVLP